MNGLAADSQDQAPLSPSPVTKFCNGLRSTMRMALDVELPPLCPSCREPLGLGTGLYAACWSKFALIEPPYCARLGIPFAYDPGPCLLSMEVIANPPAYDRARAAVRHDDVSRALLRAGAAHVDVLVFARVVAPMRATI
jgi:predicted amidophosphoribosyltransferase